MLGCLAFFVGELLSCDWKLARLFYKALFCVTVRNQCGLCKAFPLTASNMLVTLLAVLDLFFLRSPTDVAGLIAFIVVYPMQR